MAEVQAEVQCVRADEQDVLARYVGGRLSEPDAEAFEKHCLECESCWEQVRAAAEIRASTGVDALAAPKPTSVTQRDRWTLLAAAAAIAVMVLGLRQIAHRPGPSPTASVWRGESTETLRLQIHRGDAGSIVLHWLALPQADAYSIEIFGSDGESVWQRETTETEATLPPGTLARTHPGISFFVTVEALDSTGQIIATSKREKLPEP